MVIEMKADDKVLEIGCGLHKIMGENSIAIDKSTHSKADIIRDVAKRGIPFADNTFDLVISLEIIEHIEQYEDLIFFINEIHRVLKPEGVWKFTTPNGIESLNHITHHRIFTIGSFRYFEESDEDTEHMRIADGITARFKPTWGDTTPINLEGIFYAIK